MVPVDLLAEEVKSVDEEAFESTVLASEANRSQSTTFPVLCEHVSTVQINTGMRASRSSVRQNPPMEPLYSIISVMYHSNTCEKDYILYSRTKSSWQQYSPSTKVSSQQYCSNPSKLRPVC